MMERAASRHETSHFEIKSLGGVHATTTWTKSVARAAVAIALSIATIPALDAQTTASRHKSVVVDENYCEYSTTQACMPSITVYCEYSTEPCMASITVNLYQNGYYHGGNPLCDGWAQLRSYDASNEKLAEWAVPVSDGYATFTDVAIAPGNMQPQVGRVIIDYTPSSSECRSSQSNGFLSITPVHEATIPIQAQGPLAVDELTNIVYAAEFHYPNRWWENAFKQTVAAFDGTTNQLLEPLALQFGSRTPEIVWAVAADSKARKLYVYEWAESSWHDNLWIWDLDQQVVVDVIPLRIEGVPVGGDWIRVNSSTGIVYLAGGLWPWETFGLIAVDPSQTAGDQVAFTPYPFYAPNRRSIIPVVDSVNNIIYAGGAIFDGSPSNVPLPYAYNCCWPWHTRFFGVAVIPWEKTVYNPGWGYSGVELEQLDGDRTAPTFMSTKGYLPLQDALSGRFHNPDGKEAVAPRSIEAFRPAARMYIELDLDPYEHYPNPYTADLRPVPVLVSSTHARELISEWWLPIPYNRQFGRLSINPVNGRVYVPSGANTIEVYRDPVVVEEITSSGTNVTTATTAASITFAEVSAPGVTTVESVSASSLDVTLPGQFEMTGGIAYEISTTAAVTPPIQLCFTVSVTDEATFNAMTVLHAENGAWVDRTVSRDLSSGTICAETSSLSPFAIARRKPYIVKPLYDTTKPAKGNSTAAIKIEIDDATAANAGSYELPVVGIDLFAETTKHAISLLDSGNANPGLAFRFDPTLGNGGGYIFNLSTKDVAPGTYALRFHIGADGRTYSSQVVIR